MKKATKIKAVRLLTSSLMSSDLTPSELMELCQSLMDQDAFVNELGYHLHNLVSAAMQVDEAKSPDDEAIDHAIAVMKTHKISRPVLLEMASVLLPGIAELSQAKKLSVRGILTLFREHGSTGNWEILLEYLGNDAYLELILRKSG